VPIISI